MIWSAPSSSADVEDLLVDDAVAGVDLEALAVARVRLADLDEARSRAAFEQGVDVELGGTARLPADRVAKIEPPLDLGARRSAA